MQVHALMKRLVGLVVIGCLPAVLTARQLTADDCQAFIKSFVNHYEFNPEGRYAHEYHPFVLNWTAQSFDTLEQGLREGGLSLQGRVVIMGYEEQAVPAYYTNFKQPKIDDEAIRRNNAGWSLRLHNRFGFMTGFLCKDIPQLKQQKVFQHIDADRIPIFDKRAHIFHEHAFGQALPLMYHETEVINRLINQQQDREVLAEMASFWQRLYEKAFTVGNKQIAGTQDVLFSIAYAKYLLRSTLPIKNFFTGPDITYPIEVTCKQQKYATAHAQRFVEIFAETLKPVQDQNTVYVFCSFVDGVGKSTMLGNIKNWMKWQSDIDHFDHVDNSSSQLAELFQFKEKVFIADLPAQVSHFTYKPDGFVYVDARTSMQQAEVSKVEAFVKDKQAILQEEHAKIVQEVTAILAQQGCLAAALNDPAKPAYAFVKNVIMLKKDTGQQWIPFTYEGKAYLFRDAKPLEIRLLTPLGSVKSEGLKNIEAEQMLFVDGVRLPLPYQTFMGDLVKKLQDKQVKNVVFVDFLSMYPRSSRENIRVNYLLQQMVLLNDTYDPRLSLYRDFISGGELLYLLLHGASAATMNMTFMDEARVRLGLFNMILDRTDGVLDGISMADMTTRLHAQHKALKQYDPVIEQLIGAKMRHETALLNDTYGLSKSFVNIQQFSLGKAEMLYQVLQQFFTELVANEDINSLWADVGTPGAVPVIQTEGERLQGAVTSEKNIMVRGYFVCNPACKNVFILSPLIRSLRACWYTAVLNLLTADENSDEQIVIKKPYYNGVPLRVQTIKDLVYVLQQSFDPSEEAIEVSNRLQYRPFNLVSNKPACFTKIEDTCYRLEWESSDAHSGVMGYACEPFNDQDDATGDESNVITKLVRDYSREHGHQAVMPTSELWELLSTDSAWHDELADIAQQAHQAGCFKGPKLQRDRSFLSDAGGGRSYQYYLCSDGLRPIVQLVVRLLATIDMVLKDPEADVVIRDGNRDDFAAALKIIEKVLLPLGCSLYVEGDLFDDYTQVEPYPSWEWWDLAR